MAAKQYKMPSRENSEHVKEPLAIYLPAFNPGIFSDIYFKMVWSKTAQIKDNIQFINSVRRGIALKNLDGLIELTGITQKRMAEIMGVSQRTIQRKDAKSLLHPDASEKAIKLGHLYRRGFTVFDDADKFKKWMAHPNPHLKNAAPLQVLDTFAGIELINLLLDNIEYGVYA
jgi:putative toxin-antitoxin system antitoxin component (TIGR02293 family)